VVALESLWKRNPGVGDLQSTNHAVYCTRNIARRPRAGPEVCTPPTAGHRPLRTPGVTGRHRQPLTRLLTRNLERVVTTGRATVRNSNSRDSNSSLPAGSAIQRPERPHTADHPQLRTPTRPPRCCPCGRPCLPRRCPSQGPLLPRCCPCGAQPPEAPPFPRPAPPKAPPREAPPCEALRPEARPSPRPSRGLASRGRAFPRRR
jgi:hypothetical protein